jgi:AraC-like DNA-binding protein
MLSSRRELPDNSMDAWLPPNGDKFFSLWQPTPPTSECVIFARDHVHRYPPHLHDCVELVWLHAGHVRIECRGRCYVLQRGDVCLLAPNELHSTDNGGSDCTFTLIHLPSDLYHAIAAGRTPGGRRLVPEPFRILRSHSFAMQAFLEGFIATESAAERRRLAAPLLEAIMYAPHSFAVLRAEKASWHPAVVHARGVVADHIDQPLNVADMAAEVGLNARYFISLFKDGIGLPPHQYQIAMRVERARCTLQNPDSSLCDIAADTGFADQSHLNRHFKRSYGFTPGAFRRHLRHI